MPTNIQKDNNIVTLTNVFTVDASSQRRLVNMLIKTTKQVMKKQEGLISANIHKSFRWYSCSELSMGK
jgi:hypothetical protein